MSDARQLPLFADDPQTPEDINRHTSLRATMKLFQQFLYAEGKSENTINAFRSDLNLVGEYFDDKIAIGQFTTTKLDKFLEWMERDRGVSCSRKTYARRVTTLKVYFRWLKGIEALTTNPARAILQRSGPAPLSDVLSPDHIQAAVKFSRSMKKREDQDYRPELLFRLLAGTGIKKSETKRLIPDDVDRTNPQNPLLTVRQKTRNVYKERRIELDVEWVVLLDLYLAQYTPKEFIFECTARNLEYILTDIGEGAGIPFKLSFEIMRWTCAVNDYRNEIPEERIREKMGLSQVSWYETSAKIKRLTEKLELDER
jgi:site-specific recombinase XerD